jgi:protein O-mannosyl-transferase
MDSMGQPPKSRQGRDPSRQSNRQGFNSLPERRSPEDILRTIGVCCCLLLIVLVVYIQVSTHKFIICDDDACIYLNPHVRSGLTGENVKWSVTGVYAGNWFPLTWLSHMADCEMFRRSPVVTAMESGQNEGAHHLVNLLLHMASTIVLFFAMRRLTTAFWCSAFVAAMFALHPLHVESVAWAVERKDVLSGLFWMLTMLAYSGYVLRPNVWRYLFVVAMFALGLMSKSMLVTLPCVMLLLDFWPLRRWRPARFAVDTSDEAPARCAPASLKWLVIEKIPLFVMSAGVSAILSKIQWDMGAMSMVDMSNMTLPARIANAAISAVAYLRQTIWPVNLAFFYPHPVVMTDYSAVRFMLEGVAAGGLLLAITAAVLWQLRRRPYLAVGWFWYLGTLVPVIGLVQVGAQARADRYMYLPMIGLSIMLAWGAAEVAAKSVRLRRGVLVAAGILLVIWSALTANQVSYWKDSETVFKHAIEVTDDNFFAHNHLGLVYLHVFEHAKKVERNREKADKYFEMLRSEYEEAVKIAPSYDAANANLGHSYLQRDPPDYDNALRCFQASVDVNTHNGGHRCNLGRVYLSQGKIDKAEAIFRGATEVDPKYADGHALLANVLLSKGRYGEAIAEWRTIVDYYPDNIVALQTLATLLSMCPDASVRNGEEAVKLTTRAMEVLNRDSAEVPLHLFDTLATAYAEKGDFAQAVKIEENALKVALKLNQDNPEVVKLVNMFRAKLLKFQEGKPIHMSPPKDQKSAQSESGPAK